MKLSKLKSIIPEIPKTFDEKYFLTFDIDWCNDAILVDTIDLVEQLDVSATWFITHKSSLLERLDENQKFRTWDPS